MASERQGPSFIEEPCGCRVDHGIPSRCEKHAQARPVTRLAGGTSSLKAQVTPERSSLLGPANVALLAAGASHLLAIQAETGEVQVVPNPEDVRAWCSEPNQTRAPVPTLREALDKVQASDGWLVVHWTTFRDPDWAWYRAKDVRAFVAEVKAALRASEAS